MKILLDTNIIIDCLTKRMPHFEFSKDVLRECLGGKAIACMATHTANDIFYIAHKTKPDVPVSELVEAIVAFTQILETIDLTAADIKAAASLGFADFEDALISQCAFKANVDFIITRNCKDFAKSIVEAIEPQSFLERVNAI